MTGKEKLNLVINLIDDEVKSLVSGYTIYLKSEKLSAYGLDLELQKLLLDLLADTDRCITYTVKPTFASAKSIPPTLVSDIYEAVTQADVNISDQEIIADLLKRLTYKIVVLEGFANKKHVLASLDNHKQLGHNEIATKITNVTNNIRFDSRSSILYYGKLECTIPDESLEFYTCKLVFRNTRVGAKEEDILEHTVKSQNSQRAVRDAVNRINEKAAKHLGLDKILVLKAAKVRLNKLYQG
jgi:hypothetical protein